MKFEIFTDGSALGNPGPGGYGVILRSGRHYKEISAGYKLTTNNRMELTAVIRALEYLRENDPGEAAPISTESQYVPLGITRWITGWEKNGWKTADKKPVKNRELWVRLRELEKNVKPVWAWVKGHAGNPLNEACDALVQEEIKKLRR